MNKRPSQIKEKNKYSYCGNMLGEDFHSLIRKEVNENRLLHLSNISKNLSLPTIFGKFRSDSHYLATVDLFIKSTEETRNRCFFFLKKIIPNLKTYDKFLDIGPGNGKLTRLVGRNFKEITLVDPVPQVLDGISPKAYPKETVLKKITQSFLKTALPENYFDLIILSHVMYHFSLENWIDVINKALFSLKPGGTLVAVINNGLDREKLGNNFNGKTYCIKHFIYELSQLNKKTEVFYSRESFRAKDLTTMMHICGLHLHDFNGVASQENLELYIKRNYLLAKEEYKMEVYQHFIVIKNEPNA